MWIGIENRNMFTAKQSSGSEDNARMDQNKSSFFLRHTLQTKLKINEPGDSYEREADAMADHVMRMSDSSMSSTFFKPAIDGIQRKCQECEEEDKHVHRKENTGNEVQSNRLDGYINSLGSSGQSLPETTRKFFEPRFVHDFSNVRIHNDMVAAKSAQSINALAYTSGNNIVFNQGQYSPDSDSGKRLMAHELTHVVQQKNQKYQATNLVSRKINFTPDTKIKSVEFTVGTEISQSFCSLVQTELKKGRLNDKKIETFIRFLITENGTVSDSDRIFLASLYNGHFSAKIKSDAISTGKKFSINYHDIPIGEIDHIIDFGRVKADRGSIKEEAPSDALDTDDRSAVTKVLRLITDADPYDPLVDKLVHGDLKIDSVSPAQITKFSGNPDFLAFYSPLANATGTKGKTLYIPKTIDLANFYNKSAVIHELQHARDDLNAGAAISSGDSDRLELNAYVAQARYILNNILSTPSEDEKNADVATLGATNELVYIGFLYVGQSDKPKYRTLLDKIWLAAPRAISAVSIDAVFRLSLATLEAKFLQAIRTDYHMTTSQKTGLGGGKDAESFLKWFSKIP
ncbi:MAG: hypothetical protein JWP37_3787 [Mucilaginibacter sp.]|nr:hypothetical protein [Mucilaginibacter sp.]